MKDWGHGFCGFLGCGQVATHKKAARVRGNQLDSDIQFIHRCSVHSDDSYVEIKPTIDRMSHG